RKQGLAITAPDHTLIPFSNPGFGDFSEVRSIHAEDDNEAVVVVEGVAWRAGRAVLCGDGDIVSVVRERQILDDLTNIEGADDARGFPFQVDHVDRIDIAGVAALVDDEVHGATNKCLAQMNKSGTAGSGSDTALRQLGESERLLRPCERLAWPSKW